ncbi:N-acetyltransferase family protein [Nocardioides mangrovicus]|uniref:N-acetyltransferase family protein n=1 Tax=Nocardioides mangrovicus TaxID=2478913 RepID=A0A3L8NWZ0_9ACTN|nr:GNAT family N-acetyltransferase [Nocardioides mangrovicus]RLV47766.1 N-acetyltransferase family protein [Nocardioides mangrovicus]
MSQVRVAPFAAEDWEAVAAIYAAGIATGHATFEQQPPDWGRFDATRLPDHRLAARDADGSLLGWAAVSPTSAREVYAGVVEHSVYVSPAAQGRGVGRTLLRALLDSTERAGIWTVQSGIFAENLASLRLHESVGFRVVGTRERVGLMAYGPLAGQWRDVVLVERRAG